MAQWLSPVFHLALSRLGVVGQTCDSSTSEMQAGGSVQGELDYTVSLRAARAVRLGLNRINNKFLLLSGFIIHALV